MSVTLVLSLTFLLCCVAPPAARRCATAESPECLAVYREGGAPAVLRSSKCPRWALPGGARSSPPPPHTRCQIAIHQGRRRSQEDRAVCVLDIRIPFVAGRIGIKEISVGIVAVFDGHNGSEASELASKLLVEYFLLHVYFLLDGIYSLILKRSNEALTYGEENMMFEVLNLEKGRTMSPLTIFDEPFYMEVLKESLLKTINDIDATFSQDALMQNLESGSTATVVLIANGQVLVANVGDSKAMLCSKDIYAYAHKGNVSKISRRRRRKGIISPLKSSGSSDELSFLVKELTQDHHPDRDEERNRVEAAGGYIVEWAGVVRVNGELAVSRAIGDISFKKYGVISTPEITDWHCLESNASYLIAASDGIFEKMTTQDVCNMLLDDNRLQTKRKSEPNYAPESAHSLADTIIDAALERGSMDNLAIVVLPLKSIGGSGIDFEDEGNSKEPSDMFPKNPTLTNKKSDDISAATSIMPMEFFNRVAMRFNRLWVETKQKRVGCFYLSESLTDNVDYIFQPLQQKVDSYSTSHALPESLASYDSVGPPDLYDVHNLCLPHGVHIEGDKDQCTSPEVFTRLLGLLDSIPYNETISDSSETSGNRLFNFRYVLKRRFDRGSYGEVWLAFNWNCSQYDDLVKKNHKDPTLLLHNLRQSADEFNMSQLTNSSINHCFINQSDGSLFILKRIMVERGTTAYLSGLREKYFGELFLNASLARGSLAVTAFPSMLQGKRSLDFSDLVQAYVMDEDEMQCALNAQETISRRFSKLNAEHEEGLRHIARYVESFESESKEIWLVFRNEGLSLSKLIYTAQESSMPPNDKADQRVRNVQVLHPSAWWHWLRKTEAGLVEMQTIIWQLLMALKSCHDRNITHRDIKPENMIICFEDVESGTCLREAPSGGKGYHLKMRIIDFGSAIDDFTMKHLYGSGPTRSEQTYEYTPPEALLNASWSKSPREAMIKYDMWSVGVVMLELILGSPHVFQISDRTHVLLDQHLDGWSESTKELAYKLRSYMEMCILLPGISPQHHQHNGRTSKDGVWPASWKCSEEFFSNLVKSRDPLGLGFPNLWFLRLVRQLLVWYPEDRLSVDDALRHPYFRKHPQANAHGV